VTASLAWPYVEYDSSGAPVYPYSEETLTVSDLRTFTAFIDLSEGELVQLVPGPEALVATPTP
jgi:hypothetical protein